MTKNYNLPTIEQLIEARVHIGHQVKKWHPNMEQYIYTNKKGIHIFDLEKTLEALDKASQALYELAKDGKKIVFVGTKRQAKDIVEIEAKNCGALYVTERWLGGTITNFPMLKKSIKKLIDHKDKREKGEFAKYTKKERLLLDREIEKLERYFGGLTSLTGSPDALVLVDAKKEKTALKEAQTKDIPTFAIIDTNTNPEQITYPIPGNDDAIRSIAILLKCLSSAIEAGYKEFASKAAKDENAKVAAAEAAPAEETKESDDIDIKTLTITQTQAVHITKEEVLEEPLSTQE